MTSHDTGDWLSCYGHATVATPALDRLASEGCRFANNFCASPVCTPSRGAMMTGRYPQSNGLMGLTQTPYRWAYHEGERHASHIMRDLGYDTALVHHQHEARDLNTLGFKEVFRPNEVDLGRSPYERFASGDEVADLAIEYLKGRRSRSAPFYAQVGFFETHTPYDFGGAPPRKELGFDIPPHVTDDAATRAWYAGLHGAVANLDRAVGRILESLQKFGLAEDTLVIFTVDHGIEIPRAKWQLYDAGIKTALLMRWPGGGVSGGRVYDRLVSNVDLLPTVLDLVGSPIPDNMQGIGFAPWFADPSSPPRRDAVHAMMHGHFRWYECRCIRTDRYKLIRNFDPSRMRENPAPLNKRTGTAERPVVELYDLHKDPWELNNLADDPSLVEVWKHLSGRLWQTLEEVEDPILKGPVVTPYYRMAMAEYLETNSAQR